MEPLGRVAEAARNNSRWCDALCRAHGVPGKSEPTHWIKRGKIPPYMSKLVTLGGAAAAEDQLAAIRSLIESDGATPFSIKDSFQALDLTSLGFHVLFTARWIRWSVGTSLLGDPAEKLEWSVVSSPEGLVEWELAWRGSPANSDAGSFNRVFPSQLLDDPELTFLVGRQHGAAVASAALNRTDDVIGLSNVFTAAPNTGPLFPGCVRLTQALHPALPIVGYARGDELRATAQAGFTELHGLTVWQYPGS